VSKITGRKELIFSAPKKSSREFEKELIGGQPFNKLQKW
jgi:hypothetical protein